MSAPLITRQRAPRYSLYALTAHLIVRVGDTLQVPVAPKYFEPEHVRAERERLEALGLGGKRGARANRPEGSLSVGFWSSGLNKSKSSNQVDGGAVSGSIDHQATPSSSFVPPRPALLDEKVRAT